MIEATPLGHATVLMELMGLRVITDPVLSDAVGPAIGSRVFGPRRRTPPPVRADALPVVDAVLLSHSHWDHTDVPTLRRLPREAVAVVQRRNRDLVRRRFSDSRALGWGEATHLQRDGGPAVRVTAVPAKHWGARVLVDQWRGFGGFLLELDEVPSPFQPDRPLAILFAGDTARTDAYARLREQRGGRGVDLALMPIGAYDPWVYNHCTPEQAWRMAFHDLGAERILPIHYDVFRMSKERVGEPLERLRAAADADAELGRIVGVEQGAPYALS